MRTERAYSGEQCAPWLIAGGGKLRPGPARDTLLPLALSPPAVRAGGGGGAGITRRRSAVTACQRAMRDLRPLAMPAGDCSPAVHATDARRAPRSRSAMK